MNNQKPWYEKISIWIGIFAGVCTILAFVFSLLSIPKLNTASINDQVENNNEIDNSFNGDKNNNIVINGVNNGDINIGTDTIAESNEFSEQDEFSVNATYNMNTPQTASDGVNVLIEAETSFPADYVTISGVSDNSKLEPTDMHGGLYEWQFVATFYIKGTYTVTVTAYNSDGESVSDEFVYVY